MSSPVHSVFKCYRDLPTSTEYSLSGLQALKILKSFDFRDIILCSVLNVKLRFGGTRLLKIEDNSGKEPGKMRRKAKYYNAPLGSNAKYFTVIVLMAINVRFVVE
jgi:hypothetical protein